MRVLNIKQAGLLCVISLLFVYLTSGQTPTPSPKAKPTPDDDVIKIDSRLVVIPVSVTDKTGNAVTGLVANDFRIAEEGRVQTVESVGSADKVPLEIVLLFDISASTDAMFGFELETASKFLQDVMRPEDRATIFTIGETPVLVHARDTAANATAAVRTITPTKGFTAFYDTVATAADYLRKNAPEGTRRVILVLSDGEDTNSSQVQRAIRDSYNKLGDKVNTLDSKSLYQLTVTARNDAAVKERIRVLQMLQNGDTVFYSINPAGNSFQLNKMSVFGQENMQKFADDTGGTAFVPKFQPLDTKDSYQNANNNRSNGAALDQIFRQIANELRSQYLVQYYSESDYPLGQYVKLDVGIKTKPDARIRARHGYYVKK